MTGQGAFVLPQRPEGPEVRMPDVAYIPRHDHRRLAPAHVWMYRGEPLAPTFVVEEDKLSRAGSQRAALDHKMRNDFFQHGVQLAWLIDPRPDHRSMIEYFLDEMGHVQRSTTSAWRDLDRRDVLPGFCVRSAELEMTLNQDPASSEEEKEGAGDYPCQHPQCSRRFRSYRAFVAHSVDHLKDQVVVQYVAHQENH